jgi:hypothetical protein
MQSVGCDVGIGGSACGGGGGKGGGGGGGLEGACKSLSSAGVSLSVSLFGSSAAASVGVTATATVTGENVNSTVAASRRTGSSGAVRETGVPAGADGRTSFSSVTFLLAVSSEAATKASSSSPRSTVKQLAAANGGWSYRDGVGSSIGPLFGFMIVLLGLL